MKEFGDILFEIQKKGTCDSQEFHDEITKLLCDGLNIKACSVYTKSADEDKLILRGQDGFDYRDYISFELPLETIAGRAYLNAKPERLTGLMDSEEYRDKKLVEKYGLEEVIAIPIWRIGAAQDASSDTCTGSICLYPNKKSVSLQDSQLNMLAKSVSLSYSVAVDRTKARVRENIIAALAISDDLNSALHRILHRSLKDQFGVEALSIYLFDDKQKLLRLHATTGIDVDKSVHKSDMFFSALDDEYCTWRSFKKAEMLAFDDYSKVEGRDRYRELCASGVSSLIVLPIMRSSRDREKQRARGAIRAMNKRLLHGDTYELISFTEEDVDILNYVGEIIAVSAHMFRARKDRVLYFEKIMHGTSTNIQTSIQNLDALERHGNIERLLPKNLLYTVHDTREWLEDIKNQMDRLQTLEHANLKIRDAYLTSDILISTVRLFEKSAQTREIRNASITNLKDNGFYDLPMIVADPRALMTVFRNLVENSLKYRKHSSSSCSVRMEHQFDDDYVYILFSDDGIGIPEEYAQEIFDEGIRAPNAVAQDPAGTGLGLTQSREIMREMGGNLELVSFKPVTIKVTIRRSQ